jgi:hypothetical protein
MLSPLNDLKSELLARLVVVVAAKARTVGAFRRRFSDSLHFAASA